MTKEVHSMRCKIGEVVELPYGAEIISAIPGSYGNHGLLALVITYTLEKNEGF